jgi:glycosyltransferase involved in cell wall biosynthesis
LKRAIDCFCSQTYPDKELIVIYEDDDEKTKTFIRDFSGPVNIRFNEISANPKTTLGALRNTGIHLSRGKYVCQWDDDDWYHPDRIQYQWQTLENNNGKACVLTQWLVFDEVTGSAYVSNKRLWEGSIMCDKQTMMSTLYDEIQLGEDTPLIDRLKSRDLIFEINDMMGLYIYVYHGNNSWHRQHWENIFFHSQELSKSNSLLIKMILSGDIKINDAPHMIDNILLGAQVEK